MFLGFSPFRGTLGTGGGDSTVTGGVVEAVVSAETVGVACTGA